MLLADLLKEKLNKNYLEFVFEENKQFPIFVMEKQTVNRVADKQITKKLKAAGQNLDINVMDHIIIAENGYYSFNDDGIF